MGECYFCGGRPNIMCNGECQEPDYSDLENYVSCEGGEK